MTTLVSRADTILTVLASKIKIENFETYLRICSELRTCSEHFMQQELHVDFFVGSIITVPRGESSFWTIRRNDDNKLLRGGLRDEDTVIR